MHWLAFNERETFSISKFSFVSKISLEKKRGSKGGTILAIGKKKKGKDQDIDRMAEEESRVREKGERSG